eukprot:Hpha_TRINITY_DN27533_c0_g1::TRINITY_DN27533_c0_g1_i1::g.86176::m.86176
MNIFFMALIPEECARLHCDKHCVKMILEYCQLLFAVHHLFQPDTTWHSRVPPAGQKADGLRDSDSESLFSFETAPPDTPVRRGTPGGEPAAAEASPALPVTPSRRRPAQAQSAASVGAGSESESGFSFESPAQGVRGRRKQKKAAAVMRMTQVLHPCSRWLRESASNYRWLARVLTALCVEYTKRYGRTHCRESSARWLADNLPPYPPPESDLAQLKGRKGAAARFLQASPGVIKAVKDAVEGVRDMVQADKIAAEVLDRNAEPGEGRVIILAAEGYPGECTPPPLCMPSDCWLPGLTDAYRRLYCVHKARFVKWRAMPTPEWFVPAPPEQAQKRWSPRAKLVGQAIATAGLAIVAVHIAQTRAAEAEGTPGERGGPPAKRRRA